MKKLVFAIAVVLTVGFTVTSCKSEQKETKEVEKEIVKEAEEVVNKEEATETMALATYQCPMKCEGEKTYNKPGQCPTCKMDLAVLKPEGEAEEHDHGEGEHEG